MAPLGSVYNMLLMCSTLGKPDYADPLNLLERHGACMWCSSCTGAVKWWAEGMRAERCSWGFGMISVWCLWQTERESMNIRGRVREEWRMRSSVSFLSPPGVQLIGIGLKRKKKSPSNFWSSDWALNPFSLPNLWLEENCWFMEKFSSSH